MNRPSLPTRVHLVLVRLIVPSLGSSYAVQANAAFDRMDRDARRVSRRARIRLWGRELGALFATRLAERRAEGSGPRRRLGGWAGVTIDAVRLDLSYALRNLARAPGLVVVVVVSLTLGITGSAAVFTLVDSVLWQPQPLVQEPDRLVRIFASDFRGDRYGSSSFPDFLDMRDGLDALEGVAVFADADLIVGDAERVVQGGEVSANYFEVLRVALPLGRSFLPDDVHAGGAVVILGHAMWQRDFRGDPGVLGATVRVNGRPHTVVGVAPEGLASPEGPFSPSVWIPTRDRLRDARGTTWLGVIGRLAEGRTVAEAQAQLDLLAERLQSQYPGLWTDRFDQPRLLTVVPDRQARVAPNDRREVIPVFVMLFAVATLLLLIACSNVANLLLARASRRRAEVAVRLALGASRRRLIGQLLIESVLLAGMAGAAAFALLKWLTDALAGGRLPFDLPRALVATFTVDVRVALFSGAVAMATGVGFGLIPALQASRPDLVAALRGTAGGARGRRFGLRNVLVMAQIAGSLVLVTGTALFVRSIVEGRRTELGFDPSNVAVMTLDAAHGGYGDTEGYAFYSTLTERLGVLPGIRSVAMANQIPLGGSTSRWGVHVEGYDPAPDEIVLVRANIVTPGYFDLIRTPVVRGREFTRADARGALKSVIVNEAFVARYWPGDDPIGKRLTTGEDRTDVGRVVGVVADAKYGTLGAGAAEPHFWFPFAQRYASRMIVHARTTRDPLEMLPLIREEARAVDPDLPAVDLNQMSTVTKRATQPQRVLSFTLGVAGGLALLLAMTGIYGVTAYAVTQRTREVGVRVALGAHPGTIVRMIVGEGVMLSGAGLAVGLVIVAGFVQLVRGLLVGVSPLDPISLGSGLAILGLAAVAACVVPARRAAKVDAMVALRNE